VRGGGGIIRAVVVGVRREGAGGRGSAPVPGIADRPFVGRAQVGGAGNPVGPRVITWPSSLTGERVQVCMPSPVAFDQVARWSRPATVARLLLLHRRQAAKTPFEVPFCPAEADTPQRRRSGGRDRVHRPAPGRSPTLSRGRMLAGYACPQGRTRVRSLPGKRFRGSLIAAPRSLGRTSAASSRGDPLSKRARLRQTHAPARTGMVAVPPFPDYDPSTGDSRDR
jgi:hypothetical protein